MLGKKQINLIFGVVVLLFSVIAIIASSSSSKFANPFKISEEPTDSEQVVIDRKVEEATVSQGPQGPTLFEGRTLNLADEENSDTDQGSLESSIGYKVVKVIDGDTIDVEISGKIERLRLIGIDTPETVDPRKKVQCFGKEASSKTKELLEGKFVTLESDETQGERDKYKRLLRYVFLPDGTNFNLYMISEGYAHEYTYDLPYKYQAEFKQVEKEARENSKGLWNLNACPDS